MKRLLILILIALALPAGARASDRPDLVVVMVDDLGAIDSRILDRLPNIRDLFLENGLRFDSAYTETPLCCPSRATFLTGQHVRRHGVVRNNALLLDPSKTIATVLHDAGYQTMLVGKYLNHAERLSDRTPPGWDVADILLDWSATQSQWWLQGEAQTLGYMDREVNHLALAAIDATPSDKPLFLWATPRAPHKKYPGADWQPQIEARYVNDPRCSGISPWKPPTYVSAKRPNGWPLDNICRALLTVDDLVGDLRAKFDALNRHPEWMFVSDNGMAWGAHGFPQKNVPEAGRVPLYFAGPGIVPGATDALVSNIDFGPTLADLAGTSMPFADGVSFAPVLHGATTARDWMLEDHPVGGPTGNAARAHGPWWAIRTPEWHLVVWRYGGTSLFDVKADPWERHNLKNPEVRARLKALYPYR